MHIFQGIQIQRKDVIIATTNTTSIGTSPRTQDLRTDKILPSNRGIYWAIGIAVVLLFIVFAMRPVNDTAATATTGTVMSETAVPTAPTTNDVRAVPVDPADRAGAGTQTDATSGATYDDGTVNNTIDNRNVPPTQSPTQNPTQRR